MELRSYQTAVLIGRAASRWATSTALPTSSTSSSIGGPASHRYFSATRQRSQEADAPAPPPSNSSMANMASYMRQHEQQQKQQQQRQNQVSGPGSATSFASRSIFQSNDTSSAASGASLLNPWVAPRSNTSALPRSSQSVVDNNMDGLGLSSWSSPTVQDLLTNRQHLGYERPADVKYRLRPVIGRTVELQNGVDVARGLAILNMKCSLNRVRADQTKQRFHERGGLKRKRLRRERWRARFKEGFKATCSRVRVLAKQGW